jgi:hypothetical protein
MENLDLQNWDPSVIELIKSLAENEVRSINPESPTIDQLPKEAIELEIMVEGKLDFKRDKESAMLIEVKNSKLNLSFEELRINLVPKGYYPYILEFNNKPPLKDKIGIIKTNDEFDILRFHGTNGANHGVDTNDIIVRLKDWKQKFGLYIAGANDDWVMFRLEKLPENLDEFVLELDKFCPDLIAQDYHSEHGRDWSLFTVRSKIYYQKIVRLWWD